MGAEWKNGGDHGGLPGEDERLAEDGFVDVAEARAAAEQDKEIVAKNGGREHEGESDERIERFFEAECFVGEEIGDGGADSENEESGERGDSEAEPEREPINRGRRARHEEIGRLIIAGYNIFRLPSCRRSVARALVPAVSTLVSRPGLRPTHADENAPFTPSSLEPSRE
jgi:hypothetical protein